MRSMQQRSDTVFVIVSNIIISSSPDRAPPSLDTWRAGLLACLLFPAPNTPLLVTVLQMLIALNWIAFACKYSSWLGCRQTSAICGYRTHVFMTPWSFPERHTSLVPKAVSVPGPALPLGPYEDSCREEHLCAAVCWLLTPGYSSWSPDRCLQLPRAALDSGGPPGAASEETAPPAAVSTACLGPSSTRNQSQTAHPEEAAESTGGEPIKTPSALTDLGSWVMWLCPTREQMSHPYLLEERRLA